MTKKKICICTFLKTLFFFQKTGDSVPLQLSLCHNSLLFSIKMLETSIKPYLLFSHRHTLQHFTIKQQYISSNKYEFSQKNVEMDCKTSKKSFECVWWNHRLEPVSQSSCFHLVPQTGFIFLNLWHVERTPLQWSVSGHVCGSPRVVILSNAMFVLTTIWSQIRVAFCFPCRNPIHRNFKQRMHSGGAAYEIHHGTSKKHDY